MMTKNQSGLVEMAEYVAERYVEACKQAADAFRRFAVAAAPREGERPQGWPL
jgi:hypothetical protein